LVEVARGAFIDGELGGDGTLLDVLNPSTEDLFAQVQTASADDIRRAIGSARRTYDAGGWSALPREQRVAHVMRLLDALDEAKDRIRQIIVAEAGCPINSPLMSVQLDGVLRDVREFARFALTLPEMEPNPVPFSRRISHAGMLVESVRRHVPVGVVAAISAYNFPFYLNLWKIVPALVAGNTLVLRPSPLTPLAALVFADAAQAADLPRGVLNIVVDAGHEGGVMLTRDPAVDMVTFTGSSSVGERVAAQAATGLKRLQLELGGKSAQIFLPDRVDDADGAPAAVCSSHAGQGCALGTRIFVPEAAKAEVLERMAGRMAALRVGDASDPETIVGPVITAAQRDRCAHYVAVAVAAGAKVVHGGQRPSGLDRGYFFEPTLLDLPDNANPAAQDEIFGPVVGVIGYRSLDHAVEMANDSPFGLSGYVYGHDLRQAIGVAEQLRTGTVNVNSGMHSPYVSSGGFGLSGIGRERGVEGLRIYQQLQVLNVSN